MRDYEAPGIKLSLVLAAGELFAEHGFDGVTVRDIVKKAHANLGNMTYYFDSKEALYLEVIRFALDKQGAGEWISLADNAPTAKESPHGLAKAIDAVIHILLGAALDRRIFPWRNQLILRELIQPTAAWNDIIKSFVTPELNCLTRLYKKAIPDASETDATIWVFTLYSHASFYTISQKNMSDISGIDPLDPAFTRKVVDHVAKIMVLAAALPWPIDN